MKIGVFGGTFDPVHNGHLAIAAEVRAQLDLQEVWFLPAGLPWLKSGQAVSPPAQRVRMVELAIEGKPNFKVSTIEAFRPGFSYTIDTLLELKGRLGAAEWYFIMGWDSLQSLPQWKEAARLITLCRLVAVPRPGVTPPDLANLEKSLPGLTRSVIMLDRPNLDISATEIRARVAQGKSIETMVPKAVADYIINDGLYKPD